MVVPDCDFRCVAVAVLAGVNRWSGFLMVFLDGECGKAIRNVGRQRSTTIFATMEKGELRPEVLIEPELRDGEVVMLVSSENIVLW